MDLDSWLDHELQDHHEDARYALDNEAELQKFVDEWVAKQTMESWEIDYGTVVLLPQPLGIKGESCESDLTTPAPSS